MFFVSTIFVVGISGCNNKTAKQETTPIDQVIEETAAVAATPAENPALTESNLSQTISETPDTVTTAAIQPTTSLAEDTLASSPETSANPTAQEIQQALQNVGLYQGKIDGDIGRKSVAAIRQFQQDNGLSFDGKVGPRTWAKLSAYLTESSSVETTSTELAAQ